MQRKNIYIVWREAVKVKVFCEGKREKSVESFPEVDLTGPGLETSNMPPKQW